MYKLYTRKYYPPTSTLYFIFFTYLQSFHIRDILYVQYRTSSSYRLARWIIQEWKRESSVGEGKKHVEGRNRKRSEMERYRARRGDVLTRIERVIRRDPRLHSDTGEGRTRSLFPYLSSTTYFFQMYS